MARWRRGVPVRDRGPGHSYRPDRRPPTVFGAHQPGIATPQLDHLAFAALDVAAGTDLHALLTGWSAAAESLMQGGGVTVTLGLGPSLFDARFGLAGARPAALRALPPFAGDALDPAWCGGDLCVQACAREAGAARAALERVTEGAAVRWSQQGALPRAPGDRPGGTARDLLGFKGGTGNLRRGRDLDRHVWVGGRERSWMLGGSFLVVRRILVALAAWRALPVPDQERVIGRHRDTGAPLGRDHEFERLPATLPADAHAALASPRANGGAAMLRRSYSFDDGLLFMAYQQDPRRQFVPIQRRLAEHDALAAYTTHVGSAVFAVPPGARPGGFLGEELFAAARAAPASVSRRS
jgi:deferrochelatase/peroxidase EfeB